MPQGMGFVRPEPCFSHLVTSRSDPIARLSIPHVVALKGPVCPSHLVWVGDPCLAYHLAHAPVVPGIVEEDSRRVDPVKGRDHNALTFRRSGPSF